MSSHGEFLRLEVPLLKVDWSVKGKNDPVGGFILKAKVKSFTLSSRNIITVLLACNMGGSEKLKPFNVENTAKPHCFEGMKCSQQRMADLR